MALNFVFDHAQNRVSVERVASLLSTFDRSENLVDPNVFVDAGTECAILCPAPFTDAWQTSFTGIYYRNQLSDFTFPTPSNWTSFNVGSVGNTYIQSLGIAEYAQTSASLQRNQGVYISIFSYASGSDESTYVDMGWSSTPSDSSSSPISLRVYLSGKVEVFYYGVFQAYYSVHIKEDRESKRSAGTGEYFSFILLPGRKRELLFITTLGSGFKHVFEQLDPNDPDPTIVPSLPFWLQMYSVSGTPQATFQLVPLQFVSSGYLMFGTSVMQTAPPNGVTPSLAAIGDTNSYTSLTPSVKVPCTLTEAFEADGIEKEFQIRVDMASSASAYTPFLYAGSAEWPSEIALTDDSEAYAITQTTSVIEVETGKEFNPFIHASIDVPDDASGMKMHIRLQGPTALQADGLDRIAQICNRPVSVMLGESQIIDGRCNGPKQFLGLTDACCEVELEIEGYVKCLRNRVFKDRKLLSGMALSDALLYLCTESGIPESATRIDDYNVVIDPETTVSGGKFSMLIEEGDTAEKWWRQLHEKYVPTSWWGESWDSTGPILVSRESDPSASESVGTYYATYTDGVKEGGLEMQDALDSLLSISEVSILEPEATQTWVVGIDGRTLKPIVSADRDLDAEDVLSAPSGRVSNWWGEPRPFGYYDGTISSQPTADSVNEILLGRLAVTYVIAEGGSNQMLIRDTDGLPVCRGDRLTLAGDWAERRGVDGDWIVHAGPSTTFEREESDGQMWQSRPTKYVLKRPIEGLSS